MAYWLALVLIVLLLLSLVNNISVISHLGLISDPLIVSKFHNETHDSKGQENQIYTIVKGRETFYRRHTVPVTSCSEVNYVLKRYPLEAKNALQN